MDIAHPRIERRRVPTATLNRLIDEHAVLLLDAYGVLVTHSGPIPGAIELVRHLNEAQKPYYIVTNDASRTPETSSKRYNRMGLAIEPDRIITSGLVLARYFKENGLAGERCIVLGPEDSSRYVASAGGCVVSLLDRPTPDASVVIVCDEHGYPLLESLDATLSFLFHEIDQGARLHLLLPNPDLVYPAGENTYGFTAGGIATMFEKALAHRYPERADLRFIPLGKPHAPIFEEAARRSGTRDMVMVGDQLGTDIRGANELGLTSVLAPTGLTRVDLNGIEDSISFSDPLLRPDFILQSLSVDS
jgi:HAD superfamily hydrolase (TIGR01450 family)